MSDIQTWIGRYLQAWTSNDPAQIGDLFSPDAQYRTEPYTAPWTGREAIVANWLARPDDPGDTTFDWRRVAVEGDLSVVAGTTRYRAEGLMFSNLWLVRLGADGRCTSFTEYWMQHPED